MRALLVAALVVAGTAHAQSPAVIAGELLNGTRGVPSATVTVDGTILGAVSDVDGRFELVGVQPGSVRLNVRRIGFAAFDTTIDMRAGERRVVVIAMQERATVLSRVTSSSAIGALRTPVDSVAAGTIRTDTSLAFTYERFGIALLRAAMRTSSPDSSRLISPLLAGQTLALALVGATDSSAAAIEKVLRLGDLGAIDIASRTLRFNETARVRQDAILRVANTAWVEPAATLEPTFRETARILYSSSLGSLSRPAPAMTEEIFSAADSATNTLIRALRREPIPGTPHVVLANGMLFSSTWLNWFDGFATSDRPFVTSRGARDPVPTMVRTATVAVRQGFGYHAVRVPLAAGLTALYLVLPDSGVAPATILDSLEASGWPLPDARGEARSAQLILPRIHIAHETNLEPALRALGLSSLFTSARAEFGALVTPRRGAPPPCPPSGGGSGAGPCTRYRIQLATHQVSLRVDEIKVEVAAGVSVSFTDAAGAPPPFAMLFFEGRPYLIAVRDERTGTFLLMGYIADTRR